MASFPGSRSRKGEESLVTLGGTNQIAQRKHMIMQLFFRRVYLRCRANTPTVDTEMSVKDKVPLKRWKRQMTGLREGHWSEFAGHCGLLVRPARS